MSILKNLNEYTANRSKYNDWSENRKNKEEKKATYLSSNPVTQEQKDKDIKRAKAVLHAVNTMDEFSQSKAEEMEQVTVSLQSIVARISTYLSLALGGLTLYFTKAGDAISELLKGNFKNIAKVIPAGIAALVPTGLAIVLTIFWGAKKRNRSFSFRQN